MSAIRPIAPTDPPPRRRPRAHRLSLLLPGLALLLLCGGLGGQSALDVAGHSALDPAGPQAARIVRLYWIFFWVCAVVWVLVMVFLLAPLFRRRRTPVMASPDEPDIHPEPAAEKRRQVIVSALVGVTAVVLFVLLVGDMITGRGIHTIPDSNPLVIKITGHQWWWEAQYDNPVPSDIVTTANEIHIPVGRSVKFELNSNDVIHSFWVPSLHGKKDLVPGHPIGTWLQADVEGEYWGQCAEFCGHQHANMRFLVVAEAEDKFQAWLAAQRQPAPTPVYEEQKRGQQVFLSTTCVMCHTVSGTPAGGRVGPDLTHVAGRRILAAGTLPNTKGHLAGWITDPQRIKPGTHMPQNPLKPDQLKDLLEFLETLK